MYGDRCGEKHKKPLFVQKYIQNPLLMDRVHKFDFRVQVMIASTNPLIAFYHDGFLRVSLKDFNPDSKDLYVHLTNVHQSADIVKKETDEKKKEDMKGQQLRFMSEFQDYMIAEGYTSDPEWLDNYLRPLFKKALAHLLRMTSEKWYDKNSGLFRVWGFDFMMDTSLNIYFIEANIVPEIFNITTRVKEFNGKAQQDMMEIVLSLLRSRMTRVRSFMQNFVQDYLLAGKPFDKAALREEYNEIAKDKFDDDFALGSDNSWQPIVNMGLEKEKRYFGNIDPSCME